jgi:hypothetical protein
MLRAARARAAAPRSPAAAPPPHPHAAAPRRARPPAAAPPGGAPGGGACEGDAGEGEREWLAREVLGADGFASLPPDAQAAVAETAGGAQARRGAGAGPLRQADRSAAAARGASARGHHSQRTPPPPATADSRLPARTRPRAPLSPDPGPRPLPPCPRVIPQMSAAESLGVEGFATNLGSGEMEELRKQARPGKRGWGMWGVHLGGGAAGRQRAGRAAPPARARPQLAGPSSPSSHATPLPSPPGQRPAAGLQDDPGQLRPPSCPPPPPNTAVPSNPWHPLLLFPSKGSGLPLDFQDDPSEVPAGSEAAGVPPEERGGGPGAGGGRAP